MISLIGASLSGSSTPLVAPSPLITMLLPLLYKACPTIYVCPFISSVLLASTLRESSPPLAIFISFVPSNLDVS